jgi:hypothetical protein
VGGRDAGALRSRLGFDDRDRRERREQFTVFGAAGAVVCMLLSGLLLARFTPSPTQVA